MRFDCNTDISVMFTPALGFVPSVSLHYPLSPNSCIQILQTDLYTFPYWTTWENLKNGQSIFPLVIILSILLAYSLDWVLMMLGENNYWCLSPLALKRLRKFDCNTDTSITQTVLALSLGIRINEECLAVTLNWKCNCLQIICKEKG